MNIQKINTEILKMSFKKNSRVLIGIDDEKIFVCPDGYVAFILDSKDFKLDLKKILDGRPTTNIIKDHMKRITDSKSASIVDFLDVEDDKKKKIRVAQLENDETRAFVNTKYFKYFNNDARFKIISPTSQVYVYENEECVGFILPVRVGE